MIKTVCFDFFNTLARYEPTREETYITVFKEFDIITDLKQLSKSLPAADKFWREENRRSDIEKRAKDEQQIFWAQYITLVLKETGTAIDAKTALAIMARMQEFKWEFVLFDDSLTILQTLKERRMPVGLISNVGKEMESTYKILGIHTFLDFVVTSFEVGCDKPDPRIFSVAIEKAGVKPEEILYVGDHYDQDVIGSRNANMHPILLDRRGWHRSITDCPVISSLSDLLHYIHQPWIRL